MKRVRVYEFGGPEVLKLEEVEDLRPGADEVLIRVKAAGVNPYDTYMRSGNYGTRTPTLPFTPGSDAAGVVEAIGAQVSGITSGDRVYTMGTLTGAYAELALCKRSQVQPLPDRISFAQGAGIFVPYATAYRALFQIARAVALETVLIHGASGGVGLAAVQFARTAGLTIIGTAGTDEGLRLIGEQGVHHAINHRAPDYLQEILRLTSGRGVDVILEMLAHVNLSNDLKMLAIGGRAVVIGSRGDIEITPRDLMQREASVTGMMLWNTPEAELAKVYRAIHAGLENGSLHPVIGLEVPLAEATQAHRRVMEPGARGKVVLTI
jgi:NADPH:quinone reductase and related Zn-dependent oxidoreductases